MKRNDILKLATAIVVSEGAGIIGSFFTSPSIPTWYAGINKPALNPPSWVFGPVWTTLFLLMGIAAFLVWKKGLKSKEAKIAMIAFLVQLTLNSLWSILFFGYQNPFWALLEIILLWCAILFTILAFYRVSRLAAYLLIPYLLWVSFASYLNFELWKLN